MIGSASWRSNLAFEPNVSKVTWNTWPFLLAFPITNTFVKPVPIATWNESLVFFNCFTIARGDAGVVRDEFMDHLQLPPDQPIERVEPAYRRQRLREQDIIRMSAADMRELMIEDLPVLRSTIR
jgi:hypothetical protein